MVRVVGDLRPKELILFETARRSPGAFVTSAALGLLCGLLRAGVGLTGGLEVMVDRCGLLPGLASSLLAGVGEARWGLATGRQLL